MKKTARQMSDNIVVVPLSNGDVLMSSVGQDEIARRAFDLYCARGCEDGHDLDDWLSAERELGGAGSLTAA